MPLSFFDTVRPPKPTVGTIASLWENTSERSKIYPEYQDLVSDQRLPDLMARDLIPIPDPEDREGYFADSHITYWLSGLADLLKMDQRLKLEAKAVLDFGGASGRVARHVVNVHPNTKLVVADLNVNHVNFINAQFPNHALGLKISSLPHLPLADESLDLVYGHSVFTHIDVYEITWLKELERVLRPGGYLYVSVHNEDTWKVLPRTYLFGNLRNNPDFKAVFIKSQPMPGDRLVFAYNKDSLDYNCNVFHSSRYIRSVWGRIFDIVEIIPGEHAYHTIVILRKR